MLGIISYKDLRSWDNLWPGTSTSAHNWYIILLGNMYNPTPAINLVIRNLMYLNERTENIRYFIPGVIMRTIELTRIASAVLAMNVSSKTSFRVASMTR